VADTSPDQAAAAEQKSKSSGGIKLLVLALVLVGLFVAFRFLPLGRYLGAFLEFAESLGIWGPVLLAAVYIVATVFMIPGSILTLGAGFTFGLVAGSLSVMVGSVVGSLAAFLVGRTFARDFVEQKAKENPKFAAIDQAVEREGFKIVLLTRLSPVFPFNLLNYLFSITNVRTRDYFFASWIGMLPGTIMYVYLGAAAKDLTQILSGNIEGGEGQKVLLGVGLVATIAVTIYVTRIARRALKAYVPDQVVDETGS
jgi:uncharacterized membrane protein YdjX (TVP38/TMEM64 family)